MKNSERVRSVITRLAATQLGVTPEEITDGTSIPCPYPLMVDAVNELKIPAYIADAQHFSTVGGAIRSLTGPPTAAPSVPAPFIVLHDDGQE